jgi:hypothetical protein
MGHIRAFWWTRRKKNIGGLPHNLKIPVKDNIERYLLRVKTFYKIQTQTLAYAVSLSERLYPEIVAKIKKEGGLRETSPALV